jgi:hypothetical protein
MKHATIRNIVLTVIAVAAILGLTHLTAQVNWPELVRTIHGR